MATEGTFTIGGTNPDYATIQEWADSPTGDLTGVYEGLVREGVYDENVVIDTAVATTASNYMLLRPDTGAHHGGDLRSGVRVNPTTAGHGFSIATPYTRVRGMNIHDIQGRSSEAFRITGDNVRIEECLIWRLMNLQSDGIYIGADNLTTYVSNCFFGWIGRVAIHYQGRDGCTLYCYNCTAVWIGANQGTPEADNDDPVFGGHDTVTTGNTFHFKNCFAHRADSGRGKLGACYGKASGSSFGDSTNNASDDTSAPGTNAQHNLALSSQVVNDGLLETAGPNTTDDYSATVEDSYINAQSTGTNYGSNVALNTYWDSNATPNQVRTALIRMNLVNIPSTIRPVMARLKFKAADSQDGYYRVKLFLANRNWVESEVTWNNYAAGSAWGGSGAGSTSDVIEDGDGITTTHPTSVGGDYDSDFASTSLYNAGADLVVTASKMVKWLENARDGNSPVPKGGNWLDLIIPRASGHQTEEGFSSSEDTDGDRPSLEFYYDTEASPFDFSPSVGGFLDFNGVDLSSDTDYAISTDITGSTRSAWDIGSYSRQEVDGGIDGWADLTNYLETSTPVMTAEPMLLSCWGWLQADSGTTGNYAFVIGQDGVAINHSRAVGVARISGNEQLFVRSRDGATNATANTAIGTAPIRQWFHMAGAFVSSTLREAWIDGANKASNTTNVTPNAPDSSHFGARSDGDLVWGEGDGGALGEFSAWDLTGFSETDRNNLVAELSTLVDGFARNPVDINADVGEPWEGALVFYVRGEGHTDLEDREGTNDLSTIGTLTTFGNHAPVEAIPAGAIQEGAATLAASAVLDGLALAGTVHEAVGVAAVTATTSANASIERGIASSVTLIGTLGAVADVELGGIQPPADLQVTAITDTTADISWTDTNAGAANPRIYKRVNGETEWEFVEKLATTETTYQYTGLSSSTTYDFAVAYAI